MAIVTGNIILKARQFQSLAPSGTPPLVVASTTVVANLNADLLDGQHGDDYRDAAKLTGTLKAARLVGAYTGITQVGELTELKVSGILSLATTVTTGAAAGDIVLANARSLRSVNSAGTGTVPLIRLNASARAEVGAPVQVASYNGAWLGSQIGTIEEGGNNAVILSAIVPAGTNMVTVRAWGRLTNGALNDAYFEAQGALYGGNISWRIIHDLDSTKGGNNQGFALSSSGLTFSITNKSGMNYNQSAVARADFF